MESDPPKKSASIDDLPNELLTIIFEHLKIKDLIQCGLVCRLFKLICNHVRIPELIITKKIENIRDFWFYTNKQFNHQDAIEVETFCRYRSMFRFDKLKRLYFKGKKTEYDQLDVNKLTQLEQISIDIEDASFDDFELYVDLPNLRIAEIHNKSYLDAFHVIAPKLEMLKCDRFDGFHLVYPNSITYLDVSICTEAIHVLSNVQFVQFPNLLTALRSNVISMLPNLKSISVIEAFVYNRFMRHMCLLDFVKQRHDLHRFDLKIYCECVEVDSTKTIDELHHYDSPLSFQINHYNSLLENVAVIRINYNELMHLVGGKIPNDFFNKYFNTRSIQVTDNVENQEHLVKFLNRFEYLSELHLSSNSLDQSFYDSLGELNQLKKVTIENCSPSISNLDFLLKLKLLERFETDSDSTNIAALTPALFSSLNYFHRIKFFLKKPISITRTVPNVYILNWCDHFKLIKLDFNGLIRALDTLSEAKVD